MNMYMYSISNLSLSFIIELSLYVMMFLRELTWPAWGRVLRPTRQRKRWSLLMRVASRFRRTISCPYEFRQMLSLDPHGWIQRGKGLIIRPQDLLNRRSFAVMLPHISQHPREPIQRSVVIPRSVVRDGLKVLIYPSFSFSLFHNCSTLLTRRHSPRFSAICLSFPAASRPCRAL